MQELIRFRQGQVLQRLQQLLGWLALKFGRPVEQGRLIQLRLTHQDMADAIGTSRVTVTRMMRELERNGEIGYSGKNCVITTRVICKGIGYRVRGAGFPTWVSTLLLLSKSA